MISVSILGRGVRGRWRVPNGISPAVLLLAACQTPGTEDFLDTGDFEGSFDTPVVDTLHRGQSDYNGFLVFANLPRTVVDDVLPTDLQLATNVSATYENVHPIVVMYGDQLNGTYILPPPSGTVNVGIGYKEVIILIPFVRHDGGTKWHNYVVRMYLDNLPAVQVGNQYYGYFKELAVLAESAPTPTLTQVDVTQLFSTVFTLTADTSLEGFVPSTSAMWSLDNYRHAIQIMRMPLLGTLVPPLGAGYVCSSWDWNLQDATVRPVEVTSDFVQPPRSGTMSWVSQGAIVSSEKFAFQIQGLVWQLSFFSTPCSF